VVNYRQNCSDLFNWRVSLNVTVSQPKGETVSFCDKVNTARVETLGIYSKALRLDNEKNGHDTENLQK